MQKDFQNRDAVMLWMIDTQFSRRNLDAMERILLAQKKAPILERMAREKQSEAGKQFGNGTQKKEVAFVQLDKSYPEQTMQTVAATHENAKAVSPTVKPTAPSQSRTITVSPTPVPTTQPDHITVTVEEVPQPEPKPSPVIHVREEIAKMAGVSTGTVARFEQVQKKKPELIEDIRKGEMSIHQAYQQVRRDEKEAAREEKRQENAEKIETLATPLDAQGLFQTIVIDPPWDWGDEGDVNQFGRAKPDYHTMPIEDIEKLPVGKIADENCHLYLWVTNRSLPKAFRLIEAWGFRYITCLTWVKPSIGMGNYFRGSTEQVLFCVKGSQMLKRRDVGTHFEAPRGDRHSAKPDEFYKIVESCSYGPYIDIFGRKGRPGWSVWGENG